MVKLEHVDSGGQRRWHRLNRYYSSTKSPRAESAREDIATAKGDTEMYGALH